MSGVDVNMSEFNSNMYVCELVGYTRANLPHLSGVNYVCVPCDWISIIVNDRAKGDVAFFRYPNEEPARTRERIENEEQFDPSWQIYSANVVSPRTFPYDIAVGIVDELESQATTAAQVTIPPTNNHTAQPNVPRSSATGNSTPTTNQTEQPNVPRSSATGNSTPTTNQTEQPNVPRSSATGNSTPTTNHTERPNVPRSSAIGNSTPEQNNEREQANVQFHGRARNSHFDLIYLEKVLQCQVSKTVFIQNFIEDAKHFNKILNTEFAPQTATSEPTIITPRAAPIRKRSSSVKKSTDETPKQKRVARSLQLPDSYDPNDTKWTLLHREKATGLKELVKNKGIYVKADDYKNFKSIPKNNSELIFMLLALIFKAEALEVCTTSGRAPHGYTYDQVKPALDQNALLVMGMYVQEYVKKKLQEEEPITWPDPEPSMPTIFTTVRSKLQTLRNKRHALEEKAKPDITQTPSTTI